MSSNSLQQKLQLRQRLLPQQVLFARMLELTDREIEEEVKKELDENPALEQVESGDTPVAAVSQYAQSRHFDPDAPDPGSLAVARAATLSEVLGVQLSELHMPERTRRLAEFMIGSLDSNGYFTRTIPQMAMDAAMNTDLSPEPTIDEVRDAWNAIRSLDPPGIGAMDLRDCLLLQLMKLPDSVPGISDAREVVRHYFDIFSHRNFARLSEESGIGPESLKVANDLILTLNPKPAAAISAESDTAPTGGVNPDFIVEVDGDQVSVSMPNSLPELVVEQSFRLNDDAPVTEANEFIRLCAGEARGFIEMLSRRRRTLMAIVNAIVRLQSDFFRNGDDESYIKPMVLRDVADATGMDISTVSRATAGKWLATQFGVYSLKSFFNESVADASTHKVMADLRALIENEDPEAPLGDEALTEAMAKKGYNLARRTVAKYRDRLGFPPARLRRTL